MKFQEYLTEKVSKAEIDEVLRSSDILIGAEYEFELNGSENIFDEERYKRDLREYENYTAELWEYNEDMEEWRSKLEAWQNEEPEEGEYDKIKDWEQREPESPDPPNFPDYIINTYGTWRTERGSEIDQPYEEEYKTFPTFDDLQDLVVEKMTGKYSFIRNWEIHDDGSLGDTGIEIVSPPQPLSTFMRECPIMFEFIDKTGYTDDRCGFHIGISLKGGMEEVDPVKLALFTDEQYIWKSFEGRRDNEYVRSIKTTTAAGLADSIKVDIGEKGINILRKMMNIGKLSKTPYSTISHYQGVNVEHLDSDNPYI